MPSSRRLKATGLITLLVVLVIFYVADAGHSTTHSPFYTRTKEAIKARQSAEAREDILAEERQRLQRVERIEKEHNVAMSAAQSEPPKPTPSSNLGSENPYDKQKPIGPSVESVKPVAGRKIMSDGKVVHDKSGKADENDGVAKVGNVAPKSSHAVVGESEEDKEKQKVEAALNDILKKGPMIIFSKSYCPFSKKAKVSQAQRFHLASSMLTFSF
jgi:hypothetical protein